MTTELEPTPLNSADERDRVALELIDAALARHVPWAYIAQALRLPDKRAAKRRYRELQRAARLRALRT